MRRLRPPAMAGIWGALVLVTTSGLPAAHGCGAVKQELRLVVVLIVSLGSWTRRPLTRAARSENVSWLIDCGRSTVSLPS